LKLKYCIVFLFFFSAVAAGEDSLLIKVGDQAPAFVINTKTNSIQGFTMPYMKRIVLLHFWSSNVGRSKQTIKHLNRLADRYKNAVYKKAEGFEIISIAVQTDRNTWLETIQHDSLTNFSHGIAIKGYNDEVCKKYGVASVPTTILIDELGVVIAVNPRLVEIENALDQRRNFQPIRKDVVGTLAQSSNREDPLKFCKLYLFNYYGDSIEKTITSAKGGFIFSNVKLNQDFVLKLDNKININTTDPIALYSPRGEFMMDGRTKDQGFVFFIPARVSNQLTESDSSTTFNSLGQINVIKNLTFFTNGQGLTPTDEKQLGSIVNILTKNKNLKVEFLTHTDARMDTDYALQLTTYQAESIKEYFIKKGISENRLSAIAKGNKELRKICEGTIDCREEDHRLNRRVEFLIYKD
jgi:outer membrane protein OmpA-like peptidoglycan-associated protein/thiol-disulfide isomerase/thioredoxin